MNKWRNKREQRRSKKNKENYTFLDFVLDVLGWIPELILLPFRLIFLLFRSIGRLFKDGFDFW